MKVRKHRTPDDAWMVCRGKVYDVSGWRDHPGGNVIFTHAGDDFTDIFAAFHASSSHQYMEQFYIGDLDPSTESKTEAQRKFEKAYRDLRGKLITAGYFKARSVYMMMPSTLYGTTYDCHILLFHSPAIQSLWLSLAVL